MTAKAKMATNQLFRLVHLPCASTTSARPIPADAIRTQVVMAIGVVGRVGSERKEDVLRMYA